MSKHFPNSSWIVRRRLIHKCNLPYFVKREVVGFASLCIVLCSIGASQSQQKPRDSSAKGNTPAKFALLIGINDYQEFSKLDGAVNDVDDMRQLLQEVYEFDPANMLLLTDRAATRNAILDGFQRQIQNARKNPNATIYAHFSGMSHRVKDLNGDEPDGFDEVILPADARRDSAPTYITDDVLENLLSELSKYTSNVTVVYDACYWDQRTPLS